LIGSVGEKKSHSLDLERSKKPAEKKEKVLRRGGSGIG